MRLALLSFALALTSCTTMSEEPTVFTSKDFGHLGFLEGRWEGTGPGGALFYEQYTFLDSSRMRSTRFKDASFTETTDGSAIDLANGKVTSTWNEFSWEASVLSAGRACFSPVNAPSSFCWERIDNSTVHVTQRWTGEDGTPQQYVVPLRRLQGPTSP